MQVNSGRVNFPFEPQVTWENPLAIKPFLQVNVATSPISYDEYSSSLAFSGAAGARHLPVK